MVTTDQHVSRRALAEAIATMTREKQSRLQKKQTEEKERLREEMDTKKRELESLEEQQGKAREHEAREREEIETLQRSLLHVQSQVAEEQVALDLRQRIFEFAGNDTTSVKERMVREGWGEQLVTEVLRTRTLEQSLERSGGLQASFMPKDDPLERILHGQAKLYDVTDRRVLERVESFREQAANKGYLAADQLDELRKIEDTTNRFGQNEFYRQKDDHHYITRTNEVVDGIKRQLGLDWEAPGLTYGGKRL